MNRWHAAWRFSAVRLFGFTTIGNAVCIDFGLNYRHYWADITRTFFVGSPAPRLREICQIVLEAQLAAIQTVEPGVPLARVDQTARDIISQAGYGNYLVHRVGHGLGIDVHEAPSVHARNDRPLEPGMVITVEPGIYVPGLGAFASRTTSS